MRKIRFGLGGLFLLWVIGVAIWAAVALAQIARGDGLEPAPEPGIVAPTAAGEDATSANPVTPEAAASPASVVQPKPTLSLAQPPNPVRGPLVASLALSSASPASLALFDVAGRRVVANEIGSLGPGPHRVPVAKDLAAGVYWLVLRQQGVERKTQVVALR